MKSFQKKRRKRTSKNLEPELISWRQSWTPKSWRRREKELFPLSRSRKNQQRLLSKSQLLEEEGEGEEEGLRVGMLQNLNLMKAKIMRLWIVIPRNVSWTDKSELVPRARADWIVNYFTPLSLKLILFTMTFYDFTSTVLTIVGYSVLVYRIIFEL